MKTFLEVQNIVKDLTFKDWTIVVLPDAKDKNDSHPRMYLQVKFRAVDNDHPEKGEQSYNCRKWYISPHMTETEIVQTAFMAVEKATFHEVCENFKYKGIALFNRHVSVDALMQNVICEEFDVREDAFQEVGE